MRLVGAIGRRDRGYEACAAWTAKRAIDIGNRRDCVTQPLAIGSDPIQHEIRSGHRNGVTEEWTADILRAVMETATAQLAMLGNPIRGANRLVEGFSVTGHFIERSQRSNSPAILACVNMRIHSWHTTLAAVLVIQRKIFGAVLAFDDVGVLTGVERAVWAGQKRSKKSLDLLRRLQVFGVVELGVRFRVNPQVLGL